MKIFTGAQIRELDKYTIEHEPVKSIDLMERAAKSITHAITETWSNGMPVIVLPDRATTEATPLPCRGCLLSRNMM